MGQLFWKHSVVLFTQLIINQSISLFSNIKSSSFVFVYYRLWLMIRSTF